MCKQISKSVGIIFKSRFYLSSKTKLTLYYPLIYPFITYCNSTWSSTYNLNKIYYLQKRVVRAITNSDYRAHSAPLFAKLGILDIFQVNSFQIVKFMFYYHNQLLPPMFLNLFSTSSQVHNRDLEHRRRGRQRERQKTIVLISKTLALHVHYTFWYISLPSSAKQQREMTKFKVLWRT